MNFAKVGAVVRREYIESVRKRSFLFGLVATPVLMVALVLLPLFVRQLTVEETLNIAIVDRSGNWGAEVARELAAPAPGKKSSRMHLETVTDRNIALSALETRVREGELTGWIVIPDDFEFTGKFDYFAETVTDPEALGLIEHRLQEVLAFHRSRPLGIDSSAVARLLQPVTMRTLQLGREGGKEADFTQVYLKAVTLVMILFFALLPTGQILMRSVIEEKSNRVIEVLLSSLTPRELMVGKVIGLGAVGLTMLAVWALCGALLTLKTGASPWDARLASVFLLYFIPGYFFYAGVLASIGSICTSEREAQPFLTPISLMLMLPVMMGILIAQNPDHPVARVLSFVPFFTPSLMLFRHAIREPSLVETIATWLTLVGSTVLAVAASARIFEVGILMTGKRPTIPEIARWFRPAAGQRKER